MFEPPKVTIFAVKYKRMLGMTMTNLVHGEKYFITEFFIPSKEICFDLSGNFFKSQYARNGIRPLVEVQLSKALVDRVEARMELVTDLKVDVEKGALDTDPDYQELFRGVRC